METKVSQLLSVYFHVDKSYQALLSCRGVFVMIHKVLPFEFDKAIRSLNNWEQGQESLVARSSYVLYSSFPWLRKTLAWVHHSKDPFQNP